ncbi:phosphate/phosphite/phosphonate ABC transporter substrate-binding protein [Psychromonas sp. Urea-02u-13]|uniref:phosphate/phosphite/phosphonate ABC transporter substrate-binding protein n=1 Tax=Psychromonas sp. Urea-02u-13 TaxID=2058326 RepID=UPI000C33AFDA|nr:phosphate/phosphite/phosphonate ABC transporter substrate-binding protein [Psychromonas sp. Urea-02u-13]PKG37921.1 phosphate ABC transporter substrate-binding protein [Psychromonas sp. Urea-02u-13]
MNSISTFASKSASFFTVLFMLLGSFLLLQSSAYAQQKVLVFGFVPQQSASKLVALWQPIVNSVEQQTGLTIHFATAPTIPIFEQRLAKGEYDIAYMNPYHYVVFNQTVGYQAIAKARDKKIKGIIVVPKNSKVTELQDLQNSTLAFPAPAAFAATIIPQSDLANQGINYSPKYVSSHDSVYRTVAKGIYPAGGGVMRTFKSVAPEVRAQLRILWTTEGYTPHAIAVHPRVDKLEVEKIQQALVLVEQSPEGKQLLKKISIHGFEAAVDSQWNDIRQLQLKQLDK